MKKLFENEGQILLNTIQLDVTYSDDICKFNDYKTMQKRNIAITKTMLYNLKN